MKLFQLFQWVEFEHMGQYLIYYLAVAGVLFAIMYLIISEIKKRIVKSLL